MIWWGYVDTVAIITEDCKSMNQIPSHIDSSFPVIIPELEILSQYKVIVDRAFDNDPLLKTLKIFVTQMEAYGKIDLNVQPLFRPLRSYSGFRVCSSPVLKTSTYIPSEASADKYVDNKRPSS